MPDDASLPRVVGNSAVNAAQTFFESHDLIFNRVDQRNDIGIDATLTLARSGPNAGLQINLQIKGGRSYKRATHIREFYERYRGYAPFHAIDWKLWYQINPRQGFEDHHIVDVNERLKRIWTNARPMYVVVQDPDDGELYWGNLTRMADNLPLDQDLVETFLRAGTPPTGDSVLERYLARLYQRISCLGPDQIYARKSWVPLYLDFRLTPDGLQRFLRYAIADARRPRPDYVYPSVGDVPTLITYPDGTIGPSREVLDVRDHMHDEPDDEAE
jgi:hypothetical protein